jgi:hypothetical protein
MSCQPSTWRPSPRFVPSTAKPAYCATWQDATFAVEWHAIEPGGTAGVASDGTCDCRAERFLSDPHFTIEHMLLSSAASPLDLFHPLDLSDLLSGDARPFDPRDPLGLRAVVHDTRRRAGARSVVDVLVAALTRRTVRSDAEIDPYLDELKSACRQTRRFRDAIPVFQRIVTLNPSRRHEVAAELAAVHAHLGETVKAIALLETAYRGQRRLAARRRSFEFCLIGEVAATVLRQPELAREIADLGRTIALARPLVPPNESTMDVGNESDIAAHLEGVAAAPSRANGRRPRLRLVHAA